MTTDRQTSATPGPPWMVDGRPGQIIGLVAKVAHEKGLVTQSQSKQVGDHYDIGSMEAAARAWAEVGIVAIPETSEEIVENVTKNDRGTAIVSGRVRYSLTLIAPDGSYVVAHAVGAGNSHGGRHFAMARTDARKELLRQLLQMAPADPERAAETAQAEAAAARAAQRSEWSEDMRAVVAAIDACETAEELAAVGKHEAMARISIEEREQARREWARRRDDLRQLGVLVMTEDMRRNTRERRTR